MQSLDFTSEIFVRSEPNPDDDASTIPSTSNLESEQIRSSACGFQFWIDARRLISDTGDYLSIDLASEPESFCADHSYQLLVDYRLAILASAGDSKSKEMVDEISVKYEPIRKGYSQRSDEERRSIRIDWKDAVDRRLVKPENEQSSDDQQQQSEKSIFSCHVRCQLKIREILTAHQVEYDQETSRRDFELLFDRQKHLFVDLNYLADLGSEYFRDLLESKRKGVTRTVLLHVDASDMEMFLDALCTHRKLIITNRNFDVVLRLAQEFGVDKALRGCETYLIETDAIHSIRKLEYAAEYGLGYLGESIARRLTIDAKPMAALESLHEYMQMNKERLDQMHPDVLYSLNIFDGYVVL